MRRRIFLRMVPVLVSAAIVFGGPNASQAQQYPTKPIKLLVGFGPGSTADTLARLVGKHIEKTLGQTVVVENRTGNSSMIAAETVAKAPNDGYTLFMGTIAQTLVPIRKKMKFDLRENMAAISLLGVVPNVLVVHPSVPAKNVQELIALIKKNPDKYSFGTSGAGTASHLAAELFNLKSGLKVLAVHYQGGSNQTLTDLLAGRITMTFNVAATTMPHVNKGTLRALGVAQPKRARQLPNIPTMAEQGMPGFDAGIWIGLFAPAGTPSAIVDKLSATANAALKTDDVGKALDAQGIDPLGTTPAEFATFIKNDIVKWSDVLKRAGLVK